MAALPGAATLLDCKSGSDASARAEGSEGGMCASSVTEGPPPILAPPRPPLHPDALASFVDPLPIPLALEPRERRQDPTDSRRSLPFYRVAMREAEVQIHRDLPPTRMWTFEGTLPGPTIEARSGEGVLVEWVNALPDRHFLPIDHTLHGAGADLPEVRAVVHVHGAKAPPDSDGYPEAWSIPGQSFLAHYPSQQDAATLWYHDHTMGLERLNQYAGLLGCFFVRDAAEDALSLPRGLFEIPLVLCDRMFFGDGQLRYPTSGDPRAPWVGEVFGDAPLVNGKLRPYLNVEPRAYRFRVVNASNARVFALQFSDKRGFHQIGSDQGLLPAPAPLTAVTLGPGERTDLVVDFGGSAGGRVVLQNQAVPLLEVRVGRGPDAGSSSKSRPLPDVLRPIEPLRPADAAKERTLTLRDYRDRRKGRMLMLLDGRYWHEPISERPVLDSLEVWKFVNLTEDAHPIHLHLVRFQILDRQLFDVDEYLRSTRLVLRGAPVLPPPGEAGWKDTVRVDPGTVVRIIARFEGFAGRYVWHCHVLEHAANEMMRPFEVVARS